MGLLATKPAGTLWAMGVPVAQGAVSGLVQRSTPRGSPLSSSTAPADGRGACALAAVFVNGDVLDWMEVFKYLGCVLSQDDDDT